MININIPRFCIVSFKPVLKISGNFSQEMYNKNMEIKVKLAKQTIHCNISRQTVDLYSFSARVNLRKKISLLKIRLDTGQGKSLTVRRVIVIHLGKSYLLQNRDLYAKHKKNVLVVCHEISLTGAPIIGKNIARELSKDYNIFLWADVVKDYGLVADFAKYCCEVLIGFHHFQRIVKELPKLEFAILNSLLTGTVTPHVKKICPKVIALIHEFPYFCPQQMVCHIKDDADVVVFPSTQVKNSYNNLAQKKTFLLSQGFMGFEDNSDFDPSYLQIFEDKKVVLSCGTICSRKGYDIFLQTAKKYQSMYKEDDVAFVWIGKKDLHDGEYNLWQEVYRELVDINNIYMVPEQKNLESFFSKASVFYMCSRLDPCPNVVIEAMYYKTPIVLFDKGCGCVDFFTSVPQGAKIVPFLDVSIAAQEIHSLLQDPKLCQNIGEANREYVIENLNFRNYVQNLKSIANNNE
ncbi:glycosyltransferase family 4 protein [Candidatus Uabimicrobium amorphum]|uniref:Glycosyl transferase n=1 Tax=Uabimicrobium amorphum TaxID=2596890 RepID=A0A5S9IVV2_UABAM|nr:glycosyltransferase family 4 protein [Candidatus Uabimicrobium amorphum]BBM87495.1 glycosyl transferase [Candidatus Uabimicrobium amorphum]